MSPDLPHPTLSPVDETDAEFLLDVYASTIEDTVGSLGWTDDQVADFAAMQSDLQIAGYRQTHPSAEHYIISIDEERVGRLIIEWSDAALVLVDIAILKGARSAGLGSALIHNLQQAAAERALPIQLSVRIDNIRAAVLYERLGFVDYEPHTGGNSLYRSMRWMPDGSAS